MREPESVQECLYFSRQEFAPGKGSVMAWVFRKTCPKCKKGLMGRPKKTAKEYLCKACGYEEEKTKHEADVELCAKFTCPFCSKEGEATSPYKRKTLYGKPAFVIVCPNCKEKLGIYKRMGTPAKFLEKLGIEGAVDGPDSDDDE